MNIYIAEKGESFEQTKARYEQTTFAHKGYEVRKQWNGYDIKNVILGYKFQSAEAAVKHIEAMIGWQAKEQAKKQSQNEWPEVR